MFIVIDISLNTGIKHRFKKLIAFLSKRKKFLKKKMVLLKKMTNNKKIKYKKI